MVRVLVLNPFLRTRGEQVGGVAFVERRRNFPVIVPDFLWSTIQPLFWIMLVSIGMPNVAKVIIKAAARGISRPGCRICALALQSPLSDQRRLAACRFQDWSTRVIVLQGFIELVIADLCMALVTTQ